MSLTEQERIERRRGYERKYYRNPANRHKDYARGAVFTAIESGALVRATACESCAAASELEAHHPDYSKPLEVRWLCVACHKDAHRKTHCVHGHEYTPANTYFQSNGNRFCAECQRQRSRKAHHARKQPQPINEPA